MLTYVQTQFKSSSRKRDEHVKQHEARTLNKLNNVNVRLKKRGVFPLKKQLLQHIVSFPLIQNRL